MPVVTSRRSGPSRLEVFARSCSNHVLGASAAAVVVELIARRSWMILSLAAIPLWLAYRTHRGHEAQAERGRLRDRLFDSVNLGVSTLDGTGEVSDWNEALERLTGCSRAAALGRPLVSLLPGIGQTRLPQVIQDTLRRQIAQCLPQVGLTTPAGPRLVDVTVVPDAAGVTLQWDDVTERAGAEAAEQARRGTPGAHGRWRDRRFVGVGCSQPDAVRVGALARDGRPALRGGHDDSQRVVRPRPPGGAAGAAGTPRGPRVRAVR